ncbi:endonuclease/exonuclease/phosphatase family protein, putative [Plasmodium berghei]|uniref:Endonuclease/exonuclease/phosphatase family protein, putative n=3 Tax=Plasmodium berghei TaxID=5821 RepID=A0A509AM36_PLABA|nr:endonuclease/exonuclease/phosphatase family protein, putative [Plasmodium berghei ANKA]CXI45461.1 endonuclease/exonuclease/phosphatase family protein, putative [Plasmodium berghei]SCO60535.1 endonuclease/exonuclease/phosphatase family protein, putative [Plasmodium berghei]SCO62295.1 endonuclease/exonuclease/phosphatase family protein, putative [Plasmodium berghei]VUC55901.1 endonuclease/exonuclease/phosphatase family protein, putative [Plasmodium berghei ANKA]|eukprot:XP_034421711.1 endonuclease/exonuclease/phosphatase family protein, putative [Plasmodium berghei ANKA]
MKNNQNENNEKVEKSGNEKSKTVFNMKEKNNAKIFSCIPNNCKNENLQNVMKNYPLHKYRSRSESHGHIKSNRIFMDSVKERNENNKIYDQNEKKASLTSKEYQKNGIENLSIFDTKGTIKYNNKEKTCIRNNEKNIKKNDRKIVIGYNYFTNRQQMINSENINIIKNVPISIYVGTWNCEYSDFTKGYEYEKKRYTTNYLSENTKDVLYSMKLDDRHTIRSITPLIYIDPTIKGNKNNDNEYYDELANFNLGNKDEKNGEKNGDYCIHTPNKQIYPKKNIPNTSIENSTKRKTTETSIHNCNQISGKKKNNLQNYKSQETEIFSHWISPYYDIYVICLQESISDSIIECLSMYLKEINQETYEYLPLADYKLSGYGDGAFLQMKSTTIAAWVRKSKLHPKGPVKLCASKTIAFNKLNNSKGCVSILLNIFSQFVLFIGCHMPAKDQELRQKSREFILTKLSEYFSNKATSNFKDVFHHVIWMGDFNFRVHGIQIEKVVHHLKTNNLKELLKYDEGNSPYSYDLSISFQEQEINFLPTYKKNGNRPIIDKNDKNWVEKEYKLIHNIKWYKGGKQEPRIPSWTDRVFKWSCDKTQNCLTFVPNTYISPIPKEKCILMCSDHSPVSCCFQMYKMTNEEDIPSTKSIWKF